jgi:hypothetical protein
MRIAQWDSERVLHGGFLKRAAWIALPAFSAGPRSRTEAGGASCGSTKSPTVDRDGRRALSIADPASKTWVQGRRRKMRAIRRQIKAGTYDVDVRLAIILDRMFEDLKLGNITKKKTR